MGRMIVIEAGSGLTIRGASGNLATFIDLDKVELLHGNTLVVSGIECWVPDDVSNKLAVDLRVRMANFKEV